MDMTAHDKAIEAAALAMQRCNRPPNDLRNRDQREADEDQTLPTYLALARAAIAAYEAEKAKEAAPDPDGWIPWAGGECPVKGETRVELKLRGYDAGYSTHPVRARECEWRHSPDIIAYRIVKP